MIFVTGDTHGEIDMNHLSHKYWPEGKDLTKKDVVIIAGDFGVLWKGELDATEKWWIKWLNECPWTTLFIDGNHENFPRLKALPLKWKFGSLVGKVSDSIFHLKRGKIYRIEDQKIFCFGGAKSYDKQHRIYEVSWWSEEEPSFKEFGEGLERLENNDNKVDYIITHSAPSSVVEKMNHGLQLLRMSQGGSHYPWATDDITSLYLEEVINRVQFKKMYFGHYHEEWKSDKFQCIYQKVVKIGE
jgi:predicted phosphohydrolase